MGLDLTATTREILPQACVVLDAEGTVTAVHGHGEAFFGRPEREIIGTPLPQIRPFHAVGSTILRTLAAVGGPITLRMASHSRHPITALAHVIEDERGMHGYEIFLSPSTRPAWPEQELDPTESRDWTTTLQGAMEDVGIGIVVCIPDARGRSIIRHLNRSASLMLGTPETDLEGVTDPWGEEPERDPMGLTTWQRPDGSVRSLKIEVHRRHMFHRRAVVYFIQDLTVQKRREEHRQSLLEELRTKNEDLAVFSNAMAHDLKAPLRSMSACSELLAHRLGAAEGPTRELLEAIQTSGVRAGAMIDSLLRFIQLGSGAARWVEVDLLALLDEVDEDLATQRPGAVLKTDIDGTVTGDGELLRLLLQNLVLNGARYNEQAAPVVHVKAWTEDGVHALDIRDNGIGIPAGAEDLIFDPFTRLSPGRADGTGIGLATCRRIVEIHGGTIRVLPGLSDGACVEVRWPQNGAAEKN